jgi:hypothetical protein
MTDRSPSASTATTTVIGRRMAVSTNHISDLLYANRGSCAITGAELVPETA